MISDHVKGKQQFNYSKEIQQGIQLHRAIDSFTDLHPSTKEAKKIFNIELGLYSGAFVDIVYDYYLANDSSIFKTENELQNFTQEAYMELKNHVNIFPEKFKNIFPCMMAQNWLYNYRTNFGIEQSLRGLTNRAKYINKNHQGFQIFLNNKNELQTFYTDFMKDVISFSKNKKQEMVNLYP